MSSPVGLLSVVNMEAKWTEVSSECFVGNSVSSYSILFLQYPSNSVCIGFTGNVFVSLLSQYLYSNTSTLHHHGDYFDNYV